MDEIQPQTMIPKADDYTNEVERQQVLSCGQLSVHRNLQICTFENINSYFDKSIAKSARDIGRRKQHNVLASRRTFPQVVSGDPSRSRTRVSHSCT